MFELQLYYTNIVLILVISSTKFKLKLGRLMLKYL